MGCTHNLLFFCGVRRARTRSSSLDDVESIISPDGLAGANLSQLFIEQLSQLSQIRFAAGMNSFDAKYSQVFRIFVSITSPLMSKGLRTQTKPGRLAMCVYFLHVW